MIYSICGAQLTSVPPVISIFTTYYHQLPRTLGYETVFTFDSNTIAQVKAFRIYKKTPGDSAFSLVAEFANPASLIPIDLTTCCQMASSIFGNWQLGWSPNGWWQAIAKDLPPSSYSLGEYDFYVAAVDSTGVERTPSPTMAIHVVGRATITSPTSNQPTSATPTVTYKVVNSVPPIVYYTVNAYSVSTVAWWDPTGASGFHALVGGAARTVDPTTQTEDSFTFSFSATDSSNTPVVPAGKTYYLEAEGFGTVTGYQGQPVYIVIPDGVYFTVGN